MEIPHISKNVLFYLIFIGLIIVFLFLTLGSIYIGHLSLTYDEADHFNYGLQVFYGNTDKNNLPSASKMPLSVLNVVPVKFLTHFWGLKLDEQLMIFGRISTVIVSLLLGFLCFFWVRSLYGRWIGLLGFGLYVLEPNIIAHSQMITTDIYATATMTLALYIGWKFIEAPTARRAILLGLALGLCQIAKFTGILLFPILLFLVILRHGGWFLVQLKRKSARRISTTIKVSLKYGILILIFSVFVINLGFMFNRTGTALGDYEFKSDFFKTVQNISPTLNKIPIPLPYPYISGVDTIMWIERTAIGYGGIYLLGDLRKPEGFPGYYVIAFLLKVPIPILILLCVSIWDWLRTFRKNEFIRQDMYLVIPALTYSIYYNFFFQTQIGIRYLLAIFPILLIFCTRVFRGWIHFSRRTWIMTGLAACYLIISVASYFPNYLSYFNEFVINRSYAYRYLADSNLDWGQNRGNLKKFLSQNPDYIYQPSQPASGIIVIGVNELVGVMGPPEKYRWLRENFTPIGNFRNSYLIFNVSASELARIELGNP